MINHYGETDAYDYVLVKEFSDDDFLILLMYVDDMFIGSRNLDIIKKSKDQLSKSFAMKYLSPTNQILGLRIVKIKVRR